MWGRESGLSQFGARSFAVGDESILASQRPRFHFGFLANQADDLAYLLSPEAALMERVRLCIKDVDFTRRTIIVPSGYRNKALVSMLPGALSEQLQAYIERLRRVYAQDRKRNLRGVELPKAFAVKSSNARLRGRELSRLVIFRVIP